MIVTTRNFIPKNIYRYANGGTPTLVQAANEGTHSIMMTELEELYTKDQLQHLTFKLKGYLSSLGSNYPHYLYLGTFMSIHTPYRQHLILGQDGNIYAERDGSGTLYPATPNKTFAGSAPKMGNGTGGNVLRALSVLSSESGGSNNRTKVMASQEGWFIGNDSAGIDISYDLSFALKNPDADIWKTSSFLEEINTFLTTMFNVIPCIVMKVNNKPELMLL